MCQLPLKDSSRKCKYEYIYEYVRIINLLISIDCLNNRNLINILAEVSQTGKQRHIPYRDSRLTFLLQESLGGNAKLAMVCAISPVQR